jgi:hypothetical protein
MVDMKHVTIREENGHQVIVLPAGMRLGSTEAHVVQHEDSGELTITPVAGNHAIEEFFRFRDEVKLTEEDWQPIMDAIEESRKTRVFEDCNLFGDSPEHD